MDCRHYKELLDSYLCQELAVETNHQMLYHTEHCPSCRTEMASRRCVREALRRACSQDNLSDETLQRMRSRLRAEASLASSTSATTAIPVAIKNWRGRLADRLNFRILVPVSVVLALAIGVSFFANRQKNEAPLLSEALMAEAAEDHRECALHFISSTEPAFMPESAKEYDAAYSQLDKIAFPGANGLILRAAHVCKPTTRQFAHLVYTRGENLISLLVAKRDDRALKVVKQTSSDIPDINFANHAGLQKFDNGHLAIGAYQTSKHVILVVSDLPQLENEKLAQTLALPVVEHIRQMDKQAANLHQRQSRNLIASVKRREFK